MELMTSFKNQINIQHQLSMNSNEVHQFIFYTKFGRFIKYKEYLWYVYSGNIRGLAHISRVGFKYNINDNWSACAFFIHQATSNIPGVENPVYNIPLQNNILKRVNPLFYIWNSDFSEFFTISDIINYFPQNIRQHDRQIIVNNALSAFRHSYNISLNSGMFYVSTHRGGYTMFN